jgi:hypothetical protein
MGIYQVIVRSEEYSGQERVCLGVADSAKEAGQKAVEVANKTLRDARWYVDSVRLLGARSF